MFSTMNFFFKTSEHTIRGMAVYAGKFNSVVGIWLHALCRSTAPASQIDVIEKRAAWLALGFLVLDWLNEEGSTSSLKEATFCAGLGYFSFGYWHRATLAAGCPLNGHLASFRLAFYLFFVVLKFRVISIDFAHKSTAQNAARIT